MRRILGCALLAAALLGPAADAWAQYDPTTTHRRDDDTTTTTRRATTTTRSVTTTTEEPATTAPPTTTPSTIRDESEATILTEEEEAQTTTTTAPAPVVVRSEPVQVVFTPGEPVQIVAESDVAFDPDDAPTVTISGTGDDATTVQVEVLASVDEDGNLVIDVVVPEDTPESIIVVTIRARDSRGVERTLVYLFPVAGPSTTTTTANDALSLRGGSAAVSWDELPVVPVNEVPVLVRQLQASIPDDATEQRLVHEVLDSGKVLSVDGGAIVASTPAPTTSGVGVLPLVLAGGVVLFGGGLLVQRRRITRSNGGVR